MNPLYNLGIRLYKAAAHAAALRSNKVKLMLAGQRRAEEAVKEVGAHRPIWVHAASLGEFEQGRPLIERLKREMPERKIVLTFFSPSGYEVRKAYPQADAVAYLPFDTPDASRRFVEAVNPSLAIFVKYEFWGNYLTELQRRGVPTLLVSAIFRPQQPFFKAWGGMFRRMLRCYNHIFVQDEASKHLLAGIGIDNVTVAGDTRFDRVTDILRTLTDMPTIDSFVENAHNVLVAGSSWPADEALLLPWLERHPTVKSIIAPHEFDGKRIASLLEQLGPKAKCLSELEANPLINPAELTHIVVDSFGKLASIYRKATVAYVGGGFGAGIHNLNEAAVYDLPVVFGPNHSKFKEANDLKACGGGFAINDAESLDTVLTRLTTDTAARRKAGLAAGEYIRRSIGATNLIFDYITNSNI